jgi:hypothetical protein
MSDRLERSGGEQQIAAKRDHTVADLIVC